MDARCQCGSLTASIEDGIEPMTVLCHCLECQRRSGSMFGQIAYYPAASVRLSGGSREFTRQTDEGNIFTNGFCPECGSTVYAKASKYPDILGITVGAIGDPSFPAPIRSVYEQSRHHWLELPSGIPAYQRGRDGARLR